MGLWHRVRMALGSVRRWFLSHQRKPRPWTIDATSSAYRIGNDVVIARADVAIIVAFKCDLMAIDQLCLGVAYEPPDADGNLPVEYFSEDDPWFAEVLRDLEQHFPLMPDWRGQVIYPAFATNWTVIWERAQPT